MQQQMTLSAMAARQWKGYDFGELQFRSLLARTKLELGKASAAGQYEQMVSSDNAGTQLVAKAGDYMRYATYAMKAYKACKNIWSKFRSRP